ncbi:thioesterase-like superfamily-domain-containing protein [Dichomitus squalens]|uniref:Thioesterase-like superfamily-domain-containing protein n=1 Tax=Dichomitus squalens TaxID=114155 RepID=A0A4Q9NR16_9APHY|nr:thioesterase-like superfamily-domain-containing protein [Dichomitus squalens]TBU43185.1 thioesterase-like superfamily-domain-containing protein [Dichomitus squalens]TBU64808.1 thioesterase-like superfamily-domain-containing protein [Dichomitus squalens]
MVAVDSQEHEQISEALEIEQLDVNLFRSKTLYLPFRSRGVFGGQVISQSLVAATSCVDTAYSLHCYFLLSASAAVPIVYHVDRVRDGRSYVTRSVRAVQRGRTVFIMMCSFQIPEPRQPTFQFPMPLGVPPPDACDSIESLYEKAFRQARDEKVKELWRITLEERMRSPIEAKIAGVREPTDGTPIFMYWYKARNTPRRYDPAFQKCILSYISDSQFMSGIRRTLAILHRGYDSDAKVVMQTSLDHNITFYDDDFDCGDWILYVVISERAASGRGSVHGRMYTPSGTLVAICNQEGLMRVDIPSSKL